MLFLSDNSRKIEKGVVFGHLLTYFSTIEIYLVRLTEVCGKVLSEKYAYKSVKTALLLSNVIDVDH